MTTPPPQVALRPPQTVMRLARMGSAHPSRLSFLRVLLRRMRSERWRFERREWVINDQGYGHAVYTAHGPNRAYSLVAFSHHLDDENRSDRVIAEAWDSTFAMFDGIPNAEDIERLSQNVPLQEAGRIQKTELSLSRANKSVRLWNSVVEALANGQQPDVDELNRVGYLMRTTAVYGAGKFGAADRSDVDYRPLMGGPFRIEMLSVYLCRAFVADLVEHVAYAKSPSTAVVMQADIRRRLGIGNSTGLGMAPFLIHHPTLLHCWLLSKETALARVLAVETPSEDQCTKLASLCQRALINAEQWQSDHPWQLEKLADLRNGLVRINSAVESGLLQGPSPFSALLQLAAEQNLECEEQIISLLLEVNAELVDALDHCMAIDETQHNQIDGTMSREALIAQIELHYAWALAVDYQEKSAKARFWYVSAQKLEPRLGERYDEDGVEYEQPLGIAANVVALHTALLASDAKNVALFLLNSSEHRHTVRRVQRAEQFPYAEVQDNLLDATMRPIDLLRCKLAFFGANRFDPRSDRWLRIALYQGAPYPHELADDDEDWFLPPLDGATQ